MASMFKFVSWPILCGILIALLLLQNLDLQNINQQSNTAGTLQTDTLNQAHTVASYAGAVKKTAPAVVNIYTSKIIRQRSHPFFKNHVFDRLFNRSAAPQRDRIQRSLGSGVIISDNGYLLTNHHVIEGADEILVQLYDGRETLASVIGTDIDTDLAVLRISLPDLTTAPLGDPQKAQVGDIVLAIGNPYGLEQTVTQGIISAIGRRGLNINTYENFIQTDAAINPGNSGGALIDAYGNLIGINTIIYSKSGGSQGLGLAIPSDIAARVLLDIVEHGQVIRGWLGIEAQQLTPRYAKKMGLASAQSIGLLITAIYDNGPAHLAGLLPGDIITGINGRSIEDGQAGMQQVANIPPGQEVSIDLLRETKRLKTVVTVGIRPQRG